MDEEGNEGGGKAKWIILLLLLLGLAGGAFYLLTQDEKEKPEIIREGPPPIESPVYLALGTFIVNLADGKYYLKTTIQLVFAEVAPKLWLEPRVPLVMDIIITQLQILTSKELRNPRTRLLLRRDLVNKINSLFPNLPGWEDKTPVKKILISEFYRQ
ncbi:flagellar basal body-associated FliL family protein [Deltaproteobacteria bacterium TL4]